MKSAFIVTKSASFDMNTVLGISFGAALIGGMYLLKRKSARVVPKAPMYKCFFLTEDGIRGSTDSNAVLYNMLTPLIEFIDECETSLDLCFYIISDVTMVNAIIKAKQRNVKVRIITDYNTGIVNNKYAKYFYKEGIPVYTKNLNASQTIMHNKFLIRDNKILLQASLNLTKNTSKGSYDNVMITDDPYLVEPFKKQFQEMVKLFDSDEN